MMSPEIYPYDDFFTTLLDIILEGVEEVPVAREVFGIPLTYMQSTQKNGDVTLSWTYVLSRGDIWALTMINQPSDAESVWTWRATGDLEAARRDLTLLKVAVA